MDNLEVAAEIRKLYDYLRFKGCIEQLDASERQHLKIFSRDVLRQIQSGDPNWTQHVPTIVAELIQLRGLFGYQKPKTNKLVPSGAPLSNTSSAPASIPMIPTVPGA